MCSTTGTSRHLKLRRRCLQFRVRTLLILMVGCALMLSYWFHDVQPYREQAIALANLKGLAREIRTAPAEGSDFQHWLVSTVVGDGSFIRIVSVSLPRQKLTSGIWNDLVAMRYLEELGIDSCDLSQTGLQSIARLKHLKAASVRYTSIGDSDLTAFREMPNLTALHLTGTRITDQGLEQLQQLVLLRDLYVRWTAVTEQGAARLRRTLPDCRVHYQTLGTTDDR